MANSVSVSSTTAAFPHNHPKCTETTIGSSIFTTTLTTNVQNTHFGDSPLPNLIVECHARIDSLLRESHPAGSHSAAVQHRVRISLDVIATALSQYQLFQLSLSYNGGKACLVLLILILTGLHIRWTTSPRSLTDRVSLCIQILWSVSHNVQASIHTPE
ncbi:hypothetical protein PENFLA_c005G04037 [Penicillium flavigenum]|uniref:Uncharacterized protein n=1 Tax=Penicillium flavigenum TaxID=254877 RepID=A0A1V6TQ27_9EURO|nr:hypothetical protein PENFLA_c005G04037 [Penicillium flavigenum]